MSHTDCRAELASIRHVSASGRIDSWWQFLPSDGALPLKPNRILLSVRMASAPAIELEVPICSHRRTVPGAWVLVRRGEHSFLLTAARIPLDLQRIAHAEAFHPDLPIGSIALADCPEHVAAEMAEL